MGNRAIPFALLVLFFAGACAKHAPEAPVPSSPKRVIGYYFGPTVNRGFPVSKIDGELLTHVNYAFGEIREDGTAALDNPAIDSANFAEILKLKQRYPHLKVLISFGGWGGSVYFSNAAQSAESRQRFTQSMLDAFFRPFPGVFDGVDLDWEYPVRGGPKGIINRSEDRENLTALVRELRKLNMLVTIAAPAGAGHLVKYEMPELAGLLDFINIMSYDFYTAGSRIAHFNSPLGSAPDDPTPQYNIERSVEAFLAAGLPRDKLVVGVPFYGYGYAIVPPVNQGRFQPVTPPDTAGGIARPKWTGAVRFYNIANVMKDGFTRYWDEHARVPWLYNSDTQTFVSYDDAQSIAEKAAFVRNNALGGIMIWELSGDDGTLLPAIANALRSETPRRR